MVYVFGMEGVPLFEMMFVLMFLMFLGLGFILLELKNLTHILKTEHIYLKKFEEDIAHVENKGISEEPPAELVQYVQNALSQGLQKQQIENSLLQNGWDRTQIEHIFSNLEKRQ